MRILLASNASYVPPRGGSTRSNLVWLDQLAAAGHSCGVVATAAAAGTPERREEVKSELLEQEIGLPSEARDGVEIAKRGEIEVHSVQDATRRGIVLERRIREFQPDWVLVSSEDIGQVLLRAAHTAAPGRIVYLAHTPQFYPFGPASWNPDAQAADILRQAAAIVAIGHRTAAYIRTHTGVQPAVVHPPMYGEGPFQTLGRYDSGLVTIINPCAVKGISIFLELLDRHPELRFGALPGWGTTTHDRRLLEAHANIEILPKVKDIEHVLRKTRLLLVPSLWLEGFGLVVTEALLRGIPVIASDSGGLVEAKLGTGYVIEIHPIEEYEPVFDEQMMPMPVIPRQSIMPWSRALLQLLGDRGEYEAESARSFQAAAAFVAALDPAGLEKLLLKLRPNSDTRAERGHILDDLSPAKRALLLHRLRSKPS
ncbi:MAG TPA: glycosyltransferase family 4 protein [Bryobacteraceae bacterium]|nr:glycosyltransferase family 4 protein [Bryobacteraceae bacterium]